MVKLQNELDQMFSIQEDIEYDDLSKLEYMDMFIKEILRMYPIPTE